MPIPTPGWLEGPQQLFRLTPEDKPLTVETRGRL